MAERSNKQNSRQMTEENNNGERTPSCQRSTCSDSQLNWHSRSSRRCSSSRSPHEAQTCSHAKNHLYHHPLSTLGVEYYLGHKSPPIFRADSYFFRKKTFTHSCKDVPNATLEKNFLKPSHGSLNRRAIRDFK